MITVVTKITFGIPEMLNSIRAGLKDLGGCTLRQPFQLYIILVYSLAKPGRSYMQPIFTYGDGLGHVLIQSEMLKLPKKHAIDRPPSRQCKRGHC